MKSAEAYPEYQGKSENIQFLSRSEYQTAHRNNFQNATNGYYDPNTGETKPFKDNPPEPCRAQKLSDPAAMSRNLSVSAEKPAKNHIPEI